MGDPMDLSTTYLGFRLPHPLMPGASPMVDSLDTVQRLGEGGGAASGVHWRLLGGSTPEEGAPALELNVYYLATDPEEPAATVEQPTLDILLTVKQTVSIPVAVKLSPFFSSL